MPLSPGRILPRDMDSRQWSQFVTETGIQADKRVKTFTPAWTGFSSAPSGDLSYLDFGSIVFITWNGASELVGTSNAFTMTITNLPEQLWPSQVRWLPCLVVNNDFTTQGAVSVSTAGVVTFFFLQVDEIITNIDGLAPHADGFNNSNSKGVPAGWIIAYTK